MTKENHCPKASGGQCPCCGWVVPGNRYADELTQCDGCGAALYGVTTIAARWFFDVTQLIQQPATQDHCRVMRVSTGPFYGLTGTLVPFRSNLGDAGLLVNVFERPCMLFVADSDLEVA